jgi:hypothetical protein
VSSDLGMVSIFIGILLYYRFVYHIPLPKPKDKKEKDKKKKETKSRFCQHCGKKIE